MHVVDLRHWLDEKGQLVPRAKLAPFMAAIVESATAAGDAGVTITPCRKSATRRRCTGFIAAWIHDGIIDWTCNVCSEAGIISGWQGTHWDLRDADEATEATDVVVFMPLDELPTLRTLPLPASARSIMATPPTVAEAIAALPLTHDEARRLRELMQLQLDGTRGAARSRLERSMGRVEQALMFAEEVQASTRRHTRDHGPH